MPKYEVTVESVIHQLYFIDAVDEEEARSAWQDGEYSDAQTMGKSEVISIEEVK